LADWRLRRPGPAGTPRARRPPIHRAEHPGHRRGQNGVPHRDPCGCGTPRPRPETAVYHRGRHTGWPGRRARSRDGRPVPAARRATPGGCARPLPNL